MAVKLMFQFLVSLSVVSVMVWGMGVTKLTFSDKADATGYHMTCHASKITYDEQFKWEHSMEECGKQQSIDALTPLKEDKYSKIANAETDDEYQSTLTLVGATGKEIGPKHCVCCVVEDNYSICANVTMQHEHHHGHHHH